MTQVFLTVGTNPVPVLVAAYRLARHFLEKDGRPPMLILLHSTETEPMATTIQTILHARFIREGLAVDCRPESIRDASDPGIVYQSVGNLIRGGKYDHCHLHYTGGRKVMGIKAMQALVASYGSGRLSDSYLDVNRHVLLDDRGQFTGVADEREHWNLDLSQLLMLHGYTLDFYLRERHGVASFGIVSPHEPDHYANTGEAPDQVWINIALRVFDVLKQRSFGERFSNWKKQDNYLQRSRKWPKLPNPQQVPNPAVVWSQVISDSNWMQIPVMINGFFGSKCWIGADNTLDPTVLQANQLDLLIDLLHNAWLELAALHHFRNALKTRSGPVHIYHSFRTTKAPELRTTFVTRQFEIDVLAILGYQAILVSCTASALEAKLKGFEALHRVRQIGGDGARAVVISGMFDESEARAVEEELHDETGISGHSLNIWSRQAWNHFEASFNRYLDQIGWR